MSHYRVYKGRSNCAECDKAMQNIHEIDGKQLDAECAATVLGRGISAPLWLYELANNYEEHVFEAQQAAPTAEEFAAGFWTWEGARYSQSGEQDEQAVFNRTVKLNNKPVKVDWQNEVHAYLLALHQNRAAGNTVEDSTVNEAPVQESPVAEQPPQPEAPQAQQQQPKGEIKMSQTINRSLLSKVIALAVANVPETAEGQESYFTEEELAIVNDRHNDFLIEADPNALMNRLADLYEAGGFTKYQDRKDLRFESMQKLRDAGVPVDERQPVRSVAQIEFNKAQFAWVVLDTEDGKFADCVWRRTGAGRWKFLFRLEREAAMEEPTEENEDLEERTEIDGVTNEEDENGDE